MPNYLLRIYRAPSGQWSGIVFEDGEDIARIAGCESPGEVEDTAHEQFPGIEVEPRTTEEWLDRGVDGLNRLRDDGEPLTGDPDIDADNTHPGE